MRRIRRIPLSDVDTRELLQAISLDDPPLAARDAEIVRRRLDGCTYQEIGDIVGLSRERVRQLLCEAQQRGRRYAERWLKESQV